MSIETRFESYHAKHPEVYQVLLRFAKQLRRRGLDRYSMKTLFERVRWHFDFEVDNADGFKLNNSYTSRYARLLMQENESLQGLFETRRLLST